MSKKAKYYSKSMILLLLASLANFLFVFLSKILIVRNTTVELYGYIAIVILETQFIATIFLLGLISVSSIELPRVNRDSKVSLIYSYLIYAIIIAIIEIVIGGILFGINIASTYKYSFLVSSVVTFFLIFQSIFIGLKKFLDYFILSFTQSLNFFIFVVIFRNSIELKLLVILLLVSYCSGLLIVSIKNLIQHYDIISEKVKNFKNLEIKPFKFDKKRIYLALNITLNILNVYLILKIPEFLGVIEESSFLSVGRSFTILLMVIPNIVATSISPLISRSFSLNQEKEIMKVFREVMSIIFIIYGIGIIIFSYYGDLAIPLIYGEEYKAGSLPYFYLFLLAISIEGVAKIKGAVLINSNKEKEFLIGRVFMFILFVVIELIVLFTNGSVPLSLSLAYFSGVFIQLVIFNYFFVKTRKYYNKNDLRNLLLWLVFIFSSLILAICLTLYVELDLIYKILISIANLILYLLLINLTKIVNLKSTIVFVKELLPFFGNSVKKKNSKEELYLNESSDLLGSIKKI